MQRARAHPSLFEAFSLYPQTTCKHSAKRISLDKASFNLIPTSHALLTASKFPANHNLGKQWTSKQPLQAQLWATSKTERWLRRGKLFAELNQKMAMLPSLAIQLHASTLHSTPYVVKSATNTTQNHTLLVVHKSSFEAIRQSVFRVPTGKFIGAHKKFKRCHLHIFSTKRLVLVFTKCTCENNCLAYF